MLFLGGSNENTGKYLPSCGTAPLLKFSKEKKKILTCLIKTLAAIIHWQDIYKREDVLNDTSKTRISTRQKKKKEAGGREGKGKEGK